MAAECNIWSKIISLFNGVGMLSFLSAAQLQGSEGFTSFSIVDHEYRSDNCHQNFLRLRYIVVTSQPPALLFRFCSTSQNTRTISSFLITDERSATAFSDLVPFFKMWTQHWVSQVIRYLDFALRPLFHPSSVTS